MEEKEERIYIDVENDNLDRLKHLSMTREEAIELMAKEMARKYDPLKPNKEEYESVWEHELLPSTQKHFKELAEVALNALLEGK